MLIPIKYNIRYLVTRWASTLMTALTFALVVAIFVIVMSLAQGIERALTSTGDPLNVLIMRPGVQAEGQSAVPIDRYQIVRNFSGIARDEQGTPLVAPEVLVLINRPKAGDGKPTNVQIRGVHPQGIKLRPAVQVIQGRMFHPGLREIIVSRSVSRRFKEMRLGDHPALGKGRWTIVGIFDAKGTAFDSEIWSDYQELMQEFDRNAYNTVLVRALDPAAVEGLKRQADEDRRVKLEAKTEVKYYEEQTKTAGPLKAFGFFLAVIMSIGACFAGMNTMYASVAGRVREIGTLRILGFTPFSILLCFLIESVALSLAGGVLGCLISYPINMVINQSATGTANFQTFSEILFYFSITPGLMAGGLLFALIMGVLGGLMPAISAAREPILKALKQL